MKRPVPSTLSMFEGVVVPMPMLPEELINNLYSAFVLSKMAKPFGFVAWSVPLDSRSYCLPFRLSRPSETLKLGPGSYEKSAPPATDNFTETLVVPIPTFPLPSINTPSSSPSPERKFEPSAMLAAEPLSVSVDESVAAAALTVPVKVGDAENTRLPVPVSSVTSASNSDDVSMSPLCVRVTSATIALSSA